MAVSPPNLFQFAMDHSNDGFADPSDLAVLLNAIGSAGKFISSEINRAALRDIFGSVGSANVTGDEQQKLDVIGDDVVAEALLATGLVCAMSSEENARHDRLRRCRSFRRIRCGVRPCRWFEQHRCRGSDRHDLRNLSGA